MRTLNWRTLEMEGNWMGNERFRDCGNSGCLWGGVKSRGECPDLEDGSMRVSSCELGF